MTIHAFFERLVADFKMASDAQNLFFAVHRPSLFSARRLAAPPLVSVSLLPASYLQAVDHVRFCRMQTAIFRAVFDSRAR